MSVDLEVMCNDRWFVSSKQVYQHHRPVADRKQLIQRPMTIRGVEAPLGRLHEPDAKSPSIGRLKKLPWNLCNCVLRNNVEQASDDCNEKSDNAGELRSATVKPIHAPGRLITQ